MDNIYAAYKGNHLGKEKPALVTIEELQKELDHLVQEHVDTALKDGAAANGDIVTLDFEGFLDNVPFEGGKGENYDLEIGSKTFIPGFEEQLVGHKAEDIVDVNVTFPAQYQAKELAGKAVVFHCKIHAVKSKVKHQLDDAFAQHLGLKDLQSLKESIRDQLEKEKQSAADSAYLEKLLRSLVQTSSIQVSTDELMKTKDRILDFYRNSVAQYGMTLESYVQTLGTDKTQFDLAIMKEASNTAKTELLTNYIADKEKLNPTEAEINQQLRDLKDYYHFSDEKFNEVVSLHRNDIVSDIKRDKVARFLLANND